MNRIRVAALSLTLTVIAASQGLAQQHGGVSQHEAEEKDQIASPYAGMETRRVKALSDEQVADLEAGRGMGLALAAELNSYPGPSHVLELAEELSLTDAQKSRTRELLDRMKAETIPIGTRIIENETMLDRLFAEKTITVASLADTTERIAEAQGALRAAHLRYHLEMAEVLSSEQFDRYSELRGYAAKVD